MQKWVLLDEAGHVRGQVETHGPRPSEERSNPDGFREIAVGRFGDLTAERFNPTSKRWNKAPELGEAAAATQRDRALRRIERQLGPEGIDLLAELVAAKLQEKGTK